VFALAAACVTLLSTGRGDGCKEACLRHVTDPRVRATVCGRCFTESDRGAWAAALADQPQVNDAQLSSVLSDPDWAVRWGAVRALAKRKAVTDGRVLSDWVTAEPDRACPTAVHVAGARKLTTAALLQPQPAALCWERRASLEAQLELEMYSEASGVRLEAVTHLAAFVERPITRVVLEAMKSRAPETDALSAGLLVEACHLGGPPAGKAVLDVKKGQADEALVNRLLAVWSRQIDAQRKLLTAEDHAARREAIAQLADLAPLSTPELESALTDADPSNRRAAAAALAKGAGQSVAVYAKSKLDPTTPLPLETRKQWLAAVGSSQDRECADTLSAAVADERLELAARAAALPALVDCAGMKALGTVKQAQSSKVAPLRAGAVLALSGLPRQGEIPKLLEPAFSDPEPIVLAAAAHAAGALRQRTLTPRLLALMDHDDAVVRREAVLALSALETPAAVPRLIRSVGNDADPQVRAAAALALGDLGSAAAVPALITASEGDKDAKVKFVAAESLRKLGFKRSP
jgi:HEAT repeat protein